MSHQTHIPAELEQGNALPSCSGSHTVNQGHSALFFVFLLVISLFKTALDCSEVQCSVPKYKMAVICLTEKIGELR
jgi:hypothetical protein